ncbi:MAG: replication-relaxation family protein [Actinomycetota bacterium]
MDLYEHKVLTTGQLMDLYFDSQRVTERRLLNLKLYQHGVVQRFRPASEKGSYPFHFLLGDLGAQVVAAEMGVELKNLKLAKDRLVRIAYSPRLSHLVALNTFFSRLIHRCRQTQELRVTHWWGEDRVRRRWGQIVLPDALCQLEAAGIRVRFFLELDQGTESPSKLAKKLSGYHEASMVPESPQLLLFCFPDNRREASARKALVPCGMTIATTTMGRHAEDPLGEVWLALGSNRRSCLMEIRPR